MNRALSVNSTPTPNLDKMLAGQDESQAIGEFLEWLTTKGFTLGEHRDDLTDLRSCMQCNATGVKGSGSQPCSNCDGKGSYEIRLDTKFIPARYSTEELLADFFGVDLKAVESEKRSILASLR